MCLLNNKEITETQWVEELKRNNILHLNDEELIAFANYIYQCQPGLEPETIWSIIENREYKIIEDKNKTINPKEFLKDFLTKEYLEEAQEGHWINFYYYSDNKFWIFECPQ